METPEDGYVDPKDGLTWSAERGCWLSPEEVGKVRREEARTARAATKKENRSKARSLALNATDECVEYVLNLFADGVSRSSIALGFKPRFEPDSKIATAYRHVDAILLDAGITEKPYRTKGTYNRDGNGIADVPLNLEREQREEVTR